MEDNPTIANLKEKEANLNRLLQQQINQTLGSQQQTPRNLQIGELQQELIADFVNSQREREGLNSKLEFLTNTHSCLQTTVRYFSLD